LRSPSTSSIESVGKCSEIYSRGWIAVNVFEDSRPNVLRIEVEDTGLGIPEENLSRLFTVFGESESAGICTSGVGLGLTIVKSLV
jgi:signal transduction histidine kinase